jgi:LPS-assembly protein
MNRDARLFFANGHLQFSDSLFNLNAERVELDDIQHSARFEQADFQLYENHLRGSAAKILQLNADQSELYDVSYTTCDPGQNTWSLTAGKLYLDQQDGRGTAYNAVLRIKDVPIFYLPWMQFPIDNRRMSGLLIPTLAHSSRGGYQLNLPLYWNIAENTDMTITPVFFSLRGVQLNTENRYLLGSADAPQTGQIDLSWLEDDATDSNRWFTRWTHQAKFGTSTSASILLQRMSDDRFANDFNYLGNNLDAKFASSSKDVDFLRSAVTLDSELGGWSSKLLIEQYQTLNQDTAISSRPYKRLPSLDIGRQINFDNSPFNIDWKNQWVIFEREQSITGQRLHIAPTLAYPVEQSGYYFKPELQLDFTQYRIQEIDNSKHDEQRAIPILSIDSGLIFERVASSEKQWLQTLEPRLYLLYAPFKDQSALPDFDTSLQSENYNSLFNNNRFSGGDRIGDSQQLSFGLTTRLLDQDNRELFSASIGQAFYAEPRRVSLDASIDERDKSSMMTLISAKPHPLWTIQLASVYDQQVGAAIQNDFSIRHRDGDRVFNAEYHFRKDKLEQSTVSLVYPLSSRWNVFAKRQYSQLHDLPVQNLFGLAYESCCWGFKLLYEDSTDKDFENRDQTIWFQLSLKGLSSAGKDINSLLENAILGYQPLF